MHPIVPRIMSMFLFLSGFLAALLFRALPPVNPLLWLVPGGLLILGCILVIYIRGWRWLLAGCAATILVGLVLRLPFWPPASNGATDSVFGGQWSLKDSVLQVPSQFRHGRLAEPLSLQLVEGLNISVFASGLKKPRMLAFSPTGDLYVSLPSAGQVVVLPDRNRDAVADSINIFAAGLDRPHGLAFLDKDLIVAESGRLLKLTDPDGDLKSDHMEILSSDLPPGGGHWTRTVDIGPDGAFYVSAGSSCNICEEDDPRRATILRIDKSGGTSVVYALGLRNSVGLAHHPQSGELWASNNGRDRLGDDLPPEEINRIIAGGDYGWPYCYGNKIPDPDFGSTERCRDTLPPAVEMQAHSAPLGIAFGAGLNFPAAMQKMLYVAFHGSWNRTVPTGYKLIGIPFENGQPIGPPQDIVRGWLQDYSAWGRPVAPAVGPDGALYLSDDRAGVIYRISRRLSDYP